jgi:hypothetical protein
LFDGFDGDLLLLEEDLVRLGGEFVGKVLYMFRESSGEKDILDVGG